MKTTFAIVLVLFVVGLVAGFVVPPESRSEASLVVAAEQPNKPPPNRIASNRSRGSVLPIANDAASSAPPTSVLATPADGTAVPLADALGIAGLLGGGVVTVLLLRGGRPGDGHHAPRPEVPRHQP